MLPGVQLKTQPASLLLIIKCKLSIQWGTGIHTP